MRQLRIFRNNASVAEPCVSLPVGVPGHQRALRGAVCAPRHRRGADGDHPSPQRPRASRPYPLLPHEQGVEAGHGECFNNLLINIEDRDLVLF